MQEQFRNFGLLLAGWCLCSCTIDVTQDPTTCGPGTVRRGEVCQPEAAGLRCGAGTWEDDAGVCRPEGDGGGLSCGAGTHPVEGRCLPDQEGFRCGPGTGPGDGGVCLPLEVGYRCGPGTAPRDGTCELEAELCGEGTRLVEGRCIAEPCPLQGCGAGMSPVEGICQLDELTPYCGSGTRIDQQSCVADLDNLCGLGTHADLTAGSCEADFLGPCGPGTERGDDELCHPTDLAPYCGPGTQADPELGQCLVSCPACPACGPGTWHEPRAGLCLPIPTLHECGPATQVVDDQCVPALGCGTGATFVAGQCVAAYPELLCGPGTQEAHGFCTPLAPPGRSYQLVNGSRTEQFPAWNAEGTQVMFSAPYDQNGRLTNRRPYRINQDGTGLQAAMNMGLLPGNAAEVIPFGPGLLVHYQGLQFQDTLYHVQDGNNVPIVAPGRQLFNPELNPGGTLVAYARESGQAGRGYNPVILPVPQGVELLPPLEASVRHCHWLGDAYILYAWQNGDQRELMRLERSGARRTVRLASLAPNGDFTASPDLTRIAYLEPRQPDRRCLTVADPEGQPFWTDCTGERPLDDIAFQYDTAESSPRLWSPDGSWLYFSGYQEANRAWNVYRFNVYTEQFEPVVRNNQTDDHSPQVAPTGAHLLYMSGPRAADGPPPIRHPWILPLRLPRSSYTWQFETLESWETWNRGPEQLPDPVILRHAADEADAYDRHALYLRAPAETETDRWLYTPVRFDHPVGAVLLEARCRNLPDAACSAGATLEVHPGPARPAESWAEAPPEPLCALPLLAETEGNVEAAYQLLQGTCELEASITTSTLVIHLVNRDGSCGLDAWCDYVKLVALD